MDEERIRGLGVPRESESSNEQLAYAVSQLTGAVRELTRVLAVVAARWR